MCLVFGSGRSDRMWQSVVSAQTVGDAHSLGSGVSAGTFNDDLREKRRLPAAELVGFGRTAKVVHALVGSKCQVGLLA